MKKTKTNISVVNNVGIRRDANIHVGDKGPFPSGDILDANAVQETVDDAVNKVIDAAPDTLDTLKEIAQAIEGVDGITGLVGDVQDLLNNVEENELVVATALNDLNDRVNDTPKTTINVLYDELVELRDNAQLVPGLWYRITDYATTTTQEDTRSAGHPFDILVLALDNKTLSEDAKAIQHEGDAYFANSNLNAWKLQYSLDNKYWSIKNGTHCISDEGYDFFKAGTKTLNGVTYILWEAETLFYEDYGTFYVISEDESIDSTLYGTDFDDSIEDATEYGVIKEIYSATEGRGTILELTDENNNTCNYDFKNMLFKRYKVSSTSMSLLNNTYCTANVSLRGLTVSDDFTWYFTFDTGASIDSSLDKLTDVFDNKTNLNYNRYSLSNNVFIGTCLNNYLNNCFANSFLHSSSNICHSLNFSVFCYAFKNTITNADNIVIYSGTVNNISSSVNISIIGSSYNNFYYLRNSTANSSNNTVQNIDGIDIYSFENYYRNHANSQEIAKDNVVYTTYAALKAQYEAKKLTQGCLYRITDYVTTTALEDTMSAGHQFDIILLATSNSTFSEDARAAVHGTDTYFKESDISKWKLKYTFSNSNRYYNWASGDTIGKGTIYYMRDGYGNEAPYDFKNIMFKRCACPQSIYEDNNIYVSISGVGTGYLDEEIENTDSTDYVYVYTFSKYKTNNKHDHPEFIDASNLVSPGLISFKNNIILPHTSISSYNNKDYRELNNIVIIFTGQSDCFVENNTFSGLKLTFHILHELTHNDFSKSYVKDCFFLLDTLTKCNFIGSRLEGVLLEGGHILESNFNLASFNYVYGSNIYIDNCDFCNSYLEYVNFGQDTLLMRCKIESIESCNFYGTFFYCLFEYLYYVGLDGTNNDDYAVYYLKLIGKINGNGRDATIIDSTTLLAGTSYAKILTNDANNDIVVKTYYSI